MWVFHCCFVLFCVCLFLLCVFLCVCVFWGGDVCVSRFFVFFLNCKIIIILLIMRHSNMMVIINEDQTFFTFLVFVVLFM